MKYTYRVPDWKLPSEIMDDRELLMEWTDKAVKVALSVAKSKKR